MKILLMANERNFSNIILEADSKLCIDSVLLIPQGSIGRLEDANILAIEFSGSKFNWVHTS